MEFTIDMDLLISLVQNRPMLWDKTIENYKNKQANFAAWKEIFVMLNDDFETLSDKEKNEFGKLVMKKWSGARDNWMRCAKKLKEYKSGSGAKSVTKYKFYEQMLFLNKIMGHRLTESNMPLAENENIPNTEENEVPKVTVPKKRKRKDTENDIERKISGLVDSIVMEDNSRIMSFFKGIAPTIEKFNDADIVEFQFEVIKAMRNISQRTRSPYVYNSTPAPSYSQTAYTSVYPENQYRGYRTATASSTNYNVNDRAREYEVSIPETPENTQCFHQLDDTVSENSHFDFDFSKSVDE